MTLSRNFWPPGQRPSQRMKRQRFADQEKILAALQPNRPQPTWRQTAFDYIVLLPLSFILGGAFVITVYAYRAFVYAFRVEKVLASLEPTYKDGPWPISKDGDEE